MSAREYLMQVIHIDRRIDSKLEQLTRLREEAMKVNTILSDMPRGNSPNHQALADAVAKIVDLEVEINHDIDKLVDLKAAARFAINSLSNPEHQLVLEMRYLCQKQWEDIALAMKYSLASIYRIHGLALKNIIVPNVDSKFN